MCANLEFTFQNIFPSEAIQVSSKKKGIKIKLTDVSSNDVMDAKQDGIRKGVGLPSLGGSARVPPPHCKRGTPLGCPQCGAALRTSALKPRLASVRRGQDLPRGERTDRGRTGQPHFSSPDRHSRARSSRQCCLRAPILHVN